MQTVLATGHPAIPTGDFDFTPLLYMAILLLALRRARVPFKIWVFPVVLVAGGLIDSISDGLHLSTVTTVRVLALVALLMPSSGTPAASASSPRGLTDKPRMWLDTRASRRPIREGDRMSERKVGSVTYQEVGDEYFKERGLRRHAGVWSLWALGVGAVISGEFYGWNFGLGTGGFGGLLIAGVLMAVMYYGLVYSIAEMSPALPHTGGAYSFARSAMGPWGGFLTGLAENMEYVITPAVVVGAIGLLMQEIIDAACSM